MSDGTFVPRGATAWSAYNTPRIWAMVENEDDPESWRQVAALGSMAGLLNDQRKRLELAKQALIEAWPPERNKTAAAFVDLIDDLLFNMADNQALAESNAGALGQVLEALRQAKVKIEPLYRTYLEKNDDWVPGWWDNAEDELDEQAREQMRNAESIVAQPGNAIVAPDVYEFTPRVYVSERIDEPGGGFDSPVTPLPAGGPNGVGSGIAVPHDPPPPLPGSDPTDSGGGRPPLSTNDTPGSSGPSLAGVITPSPNVSLPAAAPVAPPAVSGSAVVPAAPGLVIGGAGGFGGGSPSGGGRRGLPGAVVGGSSPGRGGAPAVKPATPSWLPAGQPGARGAGGRNGRGTLPQSSMMPGVQAPGGRRRSGEGGQGPAFDPDNPWVTEQGVAPVIEPSRVRYRHDPGPGVIGLRQ